MKYTNFILTIIALLLAAHLFVRMIKPVYADSISSVNIAEVGGRKIYDGKVPTK